MKEKTILMRIKNVIKSNIERLEKRVIDDEEDTYINGSLGAYRVALEVIKNHEELYREMKK